MITRLKLYLGVIGAFFAALFMFYWKGRRDGAQTLEYEHIDARVDALLKHKEINDEVQVLDDDELANRAKRWVRNKDDK